MEYNLREMNNAILIDSLDRIIKQEIQKLKTDKNTGLIAKKLEQSKTLKLKKKNEDMVTENKNVNMVTENKNEDMVTENENILHSEDLRSSLPKPSYSPRVIQSHDRVIEIERLSNIFTQSPSFFNNDITHVKHSQILNKENMTAQLHNTMPSLKGNENIVTKNKNEDMVTENEKILYTEDLRNSLPKSSYAPRTTQSHNRVNEIERLANIFTKSPSFFNNDITHVKHSQILNKENMTAQKHNKYDNDKVSLNYQNSQNLISPNIKVKRSIKIGEYSPLNRINKCVSSHSLLMGIGEYDHMKKSSTELQRKDYTEYLSKMQQENNTSNLQKLVDYPCKEGFEAIMENKNSSEQNKLNNKVHGQEDLIQLPSNINGVKSYSFDVEQEKETKRIKQELYRFELRKQIEEKKSLELEQKRKEQIDDEAIFKLARDHGKNQII